MNCYTRMTIFLKGHNLKIGKSLLAHRLQATWTLCAIDYSSQALTLSKYFGNSARFWLGLQDDLDIEEEKNAKTAQLNSIKSFDADAA